MGYLYLFYVVIIAIYDKSQRLVFIRQVVAPGAARRYAPTADRSSTRGGSTSVRGRVRSPHMAKLHTASVPIA